MKLEAQQQLSHFLPQNKLIKDFISSNHHRINTEFIEHKIKNYYTPREQLVKSLQLQYKSCGISQPAIEQLKEDKTMTITTGHQLNLFSGPVFFMYKIINAINYAKKLKENHPEYNFLPVFWMASEDHDFNEIAETKILGKSYKWTNHTSGGPVGRMNIGGIPLLIDNLESQLSGGETDTFIVDLLRESYQDGMTLSQCTRKIVHQLFGDQNLIIIDGDDAELKKYLIPVIEKELKENTTFHSVTEANKKLEEQKYHIQVHVREINLFYLKDQVRNRIIYENNLFRVNNGDVKWNEDEICAELKKHPERFSPNALLRPIYQEIILPNLAYIGGAGEISYWHQLPKTFESFGVPFPEIRVRNSVWIINSKTQKKMLNAGVSVEDIWTKNEEELIQDLITRNEQEVYSISSYQNQIEELMLKLRNEIHEIDGSLVGKIGAINASFMKELSNLEKRVNKGQKDKHEISIQQILKAKEELFPSQIPQEREENFTTFYLKSGNKFFETLEQELDLTNTSAYLFVTD